MLLEKINNNNVIIFGTINSNLPSQRISFGMSDFAEILTNLQFVTAASQIVCRDIDKFTICHSSITNCIPKINCTYLTLMKIEYYEKYIWNNKINSR